jgi:competence protein ComEA
MRLIKINPFMLGCLTIATVTVLPSFAFAANASTQASTPIVTSAPIVQHVDAEKTKVNINTANLATFANIKGLGEKKAEAIINYRNKNGNFNSVDDLLKVPGIGEKLLAKFKEQLTVG